MRHWTPATTSFRLVYADLPTMQTRGFYLAAVLSACLWTGLGWLVA